MKKSMTLLATSLFALYGCGGGGGSSSGSTDGNKGPSNQVDYPIASSVFAPKPETTLSYSFTKDGQTEGVMTMNFTPLSGELIIAGLEEETGNEAVVQVINDLINYGITEFYVSEDIMTNVEGTEEDGSIYFAGPDRGLHEVTNAYFIGSQYITTVMHSSPLFRLKGTDVKESNPIIDISKETVSLQMTLDGEAVANMLNDFEDHSWVSSLPTNASCQVTWQQHIEETGVRKSFKISDKSIEAANLTEKNTYYINCEGMDSAEFGTSSERWFNPSIGLIEQIELMSVEQSTIEESAAVLTSIS
ncbi:conserved hypothetical protein [Vibrio crassostreae]|uniref:hypothetical protein n=1 Tax=Vibrio crassostreae TaxID=246167 RepID=UPI00104BC1A3|nr:hypothetical protein [Vibrio crassostreae]TCT73326.1 hypothetical protein EDB46_10850 [Vibrio crassostreae]CAK1946108.1 conserved hypothetical protein [Vibrio crassostreae]CAK2091672.1 conserved hypothetical protein [Vibrio crassostreae]CAK2147337.1 conserved hypothetical protein [Vibrio crassostreae]CAK2285098.1 conserved hypothetical protein [Vibrio crassostreae]